MPLVFDRDFDPAYGRPVTLSPLVRRLTAENPGPFTFTGTNTYILGRGEVALIDPGPAAAAHVAAILDATRGETVTDILVTHSHLDHSGAVEALKAATGARVLGGPRIGSPHGARAGNVDYGLSPDQVLAGGERIVGPGWTLEALATPGHLSNHLCFSLAEESALFSGDHVMAWSTSVVIPPHGSMADYRASLARLLGRPETLYFPGHGPPLRDALHFVAALLEHRLAREAAILQHLSQGPARIPEIVADLYPGLAPALLSGAGASVRAHLIELLERSVVLEWDGPDGPTFALADPPGAQAAP